MRKLIGGHYLPSAFYHERLRRERFAADDGWTPSVARILARPLAHNELFRAFGILSTTIDKRKVS